MVPSRMKPALCATAQEAPVLDGMFDLEAVQPPGKQPLRERRDCTPGDGPAAALRQDPIAEFRTAVSEVEVTHRHPPSDRTGLDDGPVAAGLVSPRTGAFGDPFFGLVPGERESVPAHDGLVAVRPHQHCAVGGLPRPQFEPVGRDHRLRGGGEASRCEDGRAGRWHVSKYRGRAVTTGASPAQAGERTVRYGLGLIGSHARAA